MKHVTKVDYHSVSKNLDVYFDDDSKAVFSCEFLRVHSPSAEVQGHSIKEKKTPLNKDNVSITNIEKVGNYAIRIIFDDGHDTGIYSWSYLRKMAEQNTKLYEDYLKRVGKINNL